MLVGLVVAGMPADMRGGQSIGEAADTGPRDRESGQRERRIHLVIASGAAPHPRNPGNAGVAPERSRLLHAGGRHCAGREAEVVGLYCCSRGSAVIHFGVRQLERFAGWYAGVSGRGGRGTGRCA